MKYSSLHINEKAYELFMIHIGMESLTAKIYKDVDERYAKYLVWAEDIAQAVSKAYSKGIINLDSDYFYKWLVSYYDKLKNPYKRANILYIIKEIDKAVESKKNV